LVFVFGLFFSCSGNDISGDAGSLTPYEPGKVYGEVAGLPDSRILLFELYGSEVNLLDSVFAGPGGSFEISFPPEREKGVYRFAMGKSTIPGDHAMQLRHFDLIWDGSTVAFRTHYASPVDSMEILLSEENTQYYQLLARLGQYHRKISTLSSALANYPRDDNFHRRLERQYRRVQNRRLNYIDNLAKRNSQSIFASIARFHKMPVISSPAGDAGIKAMKDGFFFEDQFSDPVILRTDLIPARINRYLALCHADAPGDPFELQEEMIKAVDVIMQHAIENEGVYYFVVEYLINLFSEMQDMDPVVEHLTGRYLLGSVCFEEGLLLDQASAQAMEFREGNRVPGFGFTASDGRAINIQDIESRYTLILFWGSWCPHCEGVMEGLWDIYNLYRQQEGFLEVVAIGIEEDEAVWRAHIEERGYDWINFSSFKWWDCPVAREYNLKGTPTMILLDSEKRFLQEPVRVRSLARFLSRQ
jgi:thiol-disulfide isomerase/thioredoxin